MKEIHNFIKSKTFWDRKTNLHYENFQNRTAMDKIGNHYLILSHVWSKIFSQGQNAREKCGQYDHFNIILLKNFAVIKGPEEKD